MKKNPGTPGFFYWFFHSEIFFSSITTVKKEPAIDIAGLCLPLKPQKERRFNIFN
jgi:hypothetical protein